MFDLVMLLLFLFAAVIVVVVILAGGGFRVDSDGSCYHPAWKRRFGRKTRYSDLLDSTEWKKLSNTVKERDGHKCCYCGGTTRLQVHHKYYSRYPDGEMVEPWNYPIDAFVTLCDDCYKRVHNTKRIKVYYRSRHSFYK